MPRSLKWILDHQNDLAERAEALDPDVLVDVSTPEMVLRRAAWKRVQAERDVLEAVADARDEGVSWSAIGGVLGTSAQAAQKRYSGVVTEIGSSTSKKSTVKKSTAKKSAARKAKRAAATAKRAARASKREASAAKRKASAAKRKASASKREARETALHGRAAAKGNAGPQS